MQHTIITNNEVKIVMEPRILKVGEKVSGRYRDMELGRSKKFFRVKLDNEEFYLPKDVGNSLLATARRGMKGLPYSGSWMSTRSDRCCRRWTRSGPSVESRFPGNSPRMALFVLFIYQLLYHQIRWRRASSNPSIHPYSISPSSTGSRGASNSSLKSSISITWAT